MAIEQAEFPANSRSCSVFRAIFTQGLLRVRKIQFVSFACCVSRRSVPNQPTARTTSRVAATDRRPVGHTMLYLDNVGTSLFAEELINKIVFQSHKLQGACGQGRHWLIEIPTTICHICIAQFIKGQHR